MQQWVKSAASSRPDECPTTRLADHGNVPSANRGRACSGNLALFRPCCWLIPPLFIARSARVADEKRKRWDRSKPSEFEPRPRPRYLTLYYGSDRDIIFFDVNLGKIMYRIQSTNFREKLIRRSPRPCAF